MKNLVCGKNEPLDPALNLLNNYNKWDNCNNIYNNSNKNAQELHFLTFKLIILY